ncbi:MAG: ester cyclase [Chloroflexi bacterium]|nr:ester cyclase [Chloroflexota bacterium]
MSIETNKSIVRRLFDEGVNGGDRAVVEELVAPDIVTHTPVPGIGPGRAEFLRFLGLFLSAFPEQHTEVHDLIGEDDRVAVLHTHHVTHGGEFMGMPPSGKKASIGGIEIFRVTDGQIAEFWHQDDLLGLMQQLGAIPDPQPA